MSSDSDVSMHDVHSDQEPLLVGARHDDEEEYLQHLLDSEGDLGLEDVFEEVSVGNACILLHVGV